jgi:hypothetical protein
VKEAAAPGSGTYAYTLLKNGATVAAVSCTVTGAGTTVSSCTSTGTVTVAAGDTIGLQSNSSSNQNTSQNVTWSFKIS